MTNRAPIVNINGNLGEMPFVDHLLIDGLASSQGEIISIKDLVETKNFSEKNVKNILALSLELSAISNLEGNQDLTFFVDSFDTNTFVDASSTNYNINQQQGYVELVQGGNLEAKDETIADFNLGSFIQTESYDDGENGAIRKEVMSAGGITIRENFDTLANVSTTGGTQTLNSVLSKEGPGALEVQIDFSFEGNDQAIVRVTYPTAIDISSDQFIRFYYQPISIPKDSDDDTAINLSLLLRDHTNATFLYPSEKVQVLGGYIRIEKDLSLATGIDLTNLTSIDFILDEDIPAQNIINVMGDGNANERIEEGRDISQTFSVSQDAVCKRIKLRLHRDAGVTAPLNIAIANFFGTTLAAGLINAIDVGIGAANRADYTIELDQTVQLIAGVEYKILLQSTASGAQEWFARRWNSNIEASGYIFINGNGNPGRDLVYALLTESPTGSILFDQLETEGASTFQLVGDFESQAFNLGQIPASLDQFSWNETINGDTVLAQIRFAATQGLLPSTPWSSNLSNPETNFVGITADQWYQYRIQFTGGLGSSSSSVPSVTLNYSVTSGNGSAEVISAVKHTQNPPDKFMFLWQDNKGSGSIQYFVSRDGKVTWQSVLESEKGQLVDFTVASGTQIHIRAIITGNAKLFGWSIATNENFI